MWYYLGQMSSENCYWKKIKAQRDPAEKTSKNKLNMNPWDKMKI